MSPSETDNLFASVLEELEEDDVVVVAEHFDAFHAFRHLQAVVHLVNPVKFIVTIEIEVKKSCQKFPIQIYQNANNNQWKKTARLSNMDFSKQIFQ